MTYAVKKAELGRRPVWIVEIDLDYCTRTYGVAPCVAAIGVTGPAKCFNTRKTCQDADNYDRGTKTYRFSNVPLPASEDPQFQTIPCLKDVSVLPTRIEPGKGIGKRAVLTATFTDNAHSDIGIDKYVADRGYDSAELGTLFTKLTARNPYYQGRTFRLLTGYIDDGVPPDIANFQTRTYQMERWEGPTKSGEFKVISKDPLKALDDKRAQAPRPSNGTLSAALNTSDGVFTLLPAGIGNEEYTSSGHLRIDDEVMSFTRVADTFTVSRGTNYTEAVEHDEDAPVQLCLSYAGENVVDILEDLLANYANIDPARLDLAGWASEGGTWLSDFNLTAIVTEPMGVDKLVAELCQQCQFFMWWDERGQLVRLKAVRPWAFDEVAELNDEQHVLADTQSVKDRPQDRVSQVQVYYGQKNPTEDLAKPWNFQRLRVSVDQDAESADEYAEPRISTIWSRWLSASQAALAAGLASRQLARYRNNPRMISFRLDAKDSDAWTGDTVLATIRSLTDFTGAKVPSYLQVIEVRETVVGSEYEYVLEDTQFSGRYALWAPDDIPAYPDSTPAQRSRYGWWSDDDGELSTGELGSLYA
jgi:hypothetical protein